MAPLIRLAVLRSSRLSLHSNTISFSSVVDSAKVDPKPTSGNKDFTKFVLRNAKPLNLSNLKNLPRDQRSSEELRKKFTVETDVFESESTYVSSNFKLGESVRDSYKKLAEDKVNSNKLNNSTRSSSKYTVTSNASWMSNYNGDKWKPLPMNNNSNTNRYTLDVLPTVGFASIPQPDRRHNQMEQKRVHQSKQFQEKIGLSDTDPLFKYSKLDTNNGGNLNSNNTRNKISSSPSNNEIKKSTPVGENVSSLRQGLEDKLRRQKEQKQKEAEILSARLEKKELSVENDKHQRKKNTRGPSTIVREVTLPSNGMSISELTSKLSMKIVDLTRKLEEMGELTSEELQLFPTAHRKTKLSVAAARMKIGDIGDTGFTIDKNGKKHRNKKLTAKEMKEVVELEQDELAAANKLRDRIVDADTAELIVLEMGYEVKRLEDKDALRVAAITDRPSLHADQHAAELVPRNPVVRKRLFITRAFFLIILFIF